MSGSLGRTGVSSFPAAFLEGLEAEEERAAASGTAAGRRHSLDTHLGSVDHVDGHTLREGGCASKARFPPSGAMFIT
jgi:hypothetical protein